MISKIESIKNIGNFEDYTAAGDVSLKKMNLIYAENGAGKTTLARIMQSLATGDAAIIERHKRIGVAGQPEVQIREDSNTSPFRFYNGSWNRVSSNIEVFDAHFVANNVYSGFEISSDHHKGLYQFVVGSAGVSIANKIERVKKLITVQYSTIDQLAGVIKNTAQYHDVEKIYHLKQRVGVDDEISAKTEELRLTKQQDQIRQQPLPQLIQIPVFAFEYEQLKSVLMTTVEGIGEDYLRMVESHLDKLSKQGVRNSLSWVFNGICAVNDSDGSHCPFCGQVLDGLDLIKGYNQYFSKAYTEAQSAADQAKISIDSLNIANYVLQLTTQYGRLEDNMKYWSTILGPDSPLPSFPIAELSLEEKFRTVQALIDQKAKNPVTAMSTDSVEALNDAINEVKRICTAINQFITDYNTKINERLSKIRPLQDVQNELRVLTIYKARYEEPLKGQCQRYGVLQHQLARLRSINTHLQQQQKAASSALLRQYGNTTNSYLRNVFMTPFQITDVRDLFKGASKKPNLEYTLTFNGIPILQGDDGSSNKSFKNVLSEGDKNTIAFSFFMAKLISDPGIANKIVVFDDPLTSLDLNRRNETINQLVLLHNLCQQVVVLSHNYHFLIDLNARNDIKAADKKTLMIVKGLNSSRIEDYELKREWINKYKQSIEKMESFVNNPTVAAQEDAINGIRLTMELMLKLKFCKYVPQQNCTFGDLIKQLERSSCTFVNPNKAEVIGKLKNLNSISWRTHHASIEERTIYTEVSLSITEAVNYVSMALRMLNSEL